MEETSATTEPQPFRGEDWFDPLETAVRGRIRGFIEEILEAELEGALQRPRYDRRGTTRGHCHGHRERQLVGTFGPVTLSVPRESHGEIFPGRELSKALSSGSLGLWPKSSTSAELVPAEVFAGLGVVWEATDNLAFDFAVSKGERSAKLRIEWSNKRNACAMFFRTYNGTRAQENEFTWGRHQPGIDVVTGRLAGRDLASHRKGHCSECDEVEQPVANLAYVWFGST